ncbi:MAG: oxidative damage protection protein [Chloroflexi bacterium]|nr:oxidative damage protection protein [Chloroflexota bacterium]
MSRETKTITIVQCAKFSQELPALDKPPFPGKLGQRIFDGVSALAWNLWQEQATLIINHYGLNLADPRANDFLFEQMEAFLFGGDASVPQTGVGAPAKK